MAVEGLNLSQVITALYSGEYPNAWATNLSLLTQKGLPVTDFASEVSRVTDGYVTAHIGNNGSVIGYTVKGTPQVTVSPTVPNSNNAIIARGTISAPVSTTVNTTNNTAILSRLSGVGTKVATSAALVGTAAMCVGAGITLGKTFDGALYNLNPDFFDSNGLGAFNPETWNALTMGDDSLGASVLNVLFGFDENGNGQAYIDENAMAYFASYLQNKGAFADTYNVLDDYTVEGYTLNQPINFADFACTTPFANGYRTIDFPYLTRSRGLQNAYFWVPDNPCTLRIIFNSIGSLPFYNPSFLISILNNVPNSRVNFHVPTVSPSDTGRGTDTKTINGLDVLCTYIAATMGGIEIPNWGIPFSSNPQPLDTRSYHRACWLSVYGSFSKIGGVEGIDNQPGATTPQNLTGNPVTDLELLRSQYPDVFNNGIDYPVIQPDGTVKNYHYVPVNLPDSFERVGTQPESGTATQTSTEINPSTSPQELVDTLTKILTNPMPETKTELENDNPPENPTDTGDGSSPVPIVPVGSASALWKIYHPTQAQVDQFGGWLWSSAFVDQLLKIFNNPMESIIGLHKVYATPIDSGNTTIKVGYLDSQVPSAYIEEQYITVDCGSVDLYEVFGSVFDYSPFTDVNLYLPFVGIVRLDVSDVMRSTIGIKYGVDVLTGACLAMVTVSRDGYDSILYQYSGNCAVQYPISSGSYMGIVSSIISVAGGVAATIATGGGAAPLALGVAGGAISAHTNVQHSGSFSGNAGAMGGKIPYLIISRPQTKLNSRYSEMEGTPNNYYVTVGECSGYIEARAVHVINVNATDSELDEIQSLLMNGIII